MLRRDVQTVNRKYKIKINKKKNRHLPAYQLTTTQKDLYEKQSLIPN